MKEIREILDQMASLTANEKAVLATVVDLQGSGYRRPGARMLIKANGDAIGTVSGGCLEADMLERAKRVLLTGCPEVFVYDTTSDENSVFSLNMGCRGVLRVLLEPVQFDSPIIAALRRAYEYRETVDSAVAIRIRRSDACTVGERFFLGGEGSIEPVAGLMDDLRTFAGSGSNYETIRYEEEDSLVEFTFETIKPPVRMLILGAGADAVPLANAAYSLGWQVNVYDHRPAFLTQARFPNADQIISIDRDAPVELSADELTAIVVMNHNYERDRTMLIPSLRSNAFYVGALGPKKRTVQMLWELNETPDPERLRAPAGLDIGAETPEAIAISIVAEVQSVLRHRNGGPLRDRGAPIYDRK